MSRRLRKVINGMNGFVSPKKPLITAYSALKIAAFTVADNLIFIEAKGDEKTKPAGS